MTDSMLLAGAGDELSGEQQLNYEVSERHIGSYFAYCRTLPAEMRIRLFGPCLRGKAFYRSLGDVFDSGPANEAADEICAAVWELYKEKLPPGDVDVEATRAWWAKNEAKYAWNPAPPRPPTEPTPIPKRELLSPSKVLSTPQPEKPAEKKAAPVVKASDPLGITGLWVSASVLVLVAAFVGWKLRK